MDMDWTAYGQEATSDYEQFCRPSLIPPLPPFRNGTACHFYFLMIIFSLRKHYFLGHCNTLNIPYLFELNRNAFTDSTKTTLKSPANRQHSTVLPSPHRKRRQGSSFT